METRSIWTGCQLMSVIILKNKMQSNVRLINYFYMFSNTHFNFFFSLPGKIKLFKNVQVCNKLFLYFLKLIWKKTHDKYIYIYDGTHINMLMPDHWNIN